MMICCYVTGFFECENRPWENLAKNWAVRLETERYSTRSTNMSTYISSSSVIIGKLSLLSHSHITTLLIFLLYIIIIFTYYLPLLGKRKASNDATTRVKMLINEYNQKIEKEVQNNANFDNIYMKMTLDSIFLFVISNFKID